MNVGPSDIIKGIQILNWIWQNGFVRENSKDRRYELFRRDVQDFDAVLQDLAKALSCAESRYRQRGLDSAINPRDPAFEQERCRLVGAFDQTLEECQRVLAKHLITPRTNAQGKLQSLIWAAKVEDRVNELRRRLQFHTQKMLLVVNRLSLRLMTDSADRLDDILALSEQSVAYHERTHAMMQDLFSRLDAFIQGRVPSTVRLLSAETPAISEELAQRFQTTLSVNAPPAFVLVGYDLRELPMDETFDVLMIHSTIDADAATGSQTPEHYVQLLKALWLARQLKSSQSYLNARPGYYYRRAINQVEQNLLARLRDPRLISFDGDLLVALSNEVYEVWPSPEPVLTMSQLDAQPNEREEARLDLVLQGGFTRQRIVIFRGSEDRFRIVQENVRDAEPRVEQQIPLSFDMTHDHFIPWYSLPQVDQSVHEVAISNRSTGMLESYRFRSSSDLYRFQEVILGQRMDFEDPKVEFSMSNGFRGKGRIQIWKEVVAPGPPTGEQCHDTLSSNSTVSPGSLGSAGMGSTTGSFAPSAIFEHAEGTEGGSIPTASLVILTELKGRVTYVYIELSQGIQVFHGHCACGNGLAGYQNCQILSLGKEERRKFLIRVQQANVDAQGQTIVQSCDISVFRLPLDPRLNKSSSHMIDSLKMTFETPKAKDAFNLELHQRFELRDAIIKQHNNYDCAMRRNAERPEKVRTPQTPGRNYLARTASVAPSIGSLQMGSSFADGVADTVGIAPSASTPEQGTTNVPSQSPAQASAVMPTRGLEPHAQQAPAFRQRVIQSPETRPSRRRSAISSSLRNLFHQSRSPIIDIG